MLNPVHWFPFKEAWDREKKKKGRNQKLRENLQDQGYTSEMSPASNSTSIMLGIWPTLHISIGFQ